MSITLGYWAKLNMKRTYKLRGNVWRWCRRLRRAKLLYDCLSYTVYYPLAFGSCRVHFLALLALVFVAGYVNGISAVLSGSVPAIGALLSPLYYQFFLDKLAASFAPRFHVNIYKCKRISETGAQQMLLDTHAVKTLLLEVPSLGGQNVASASYNKFVGREMGKAEALLKVILSPVESIADTYRALLLEGSAADFQRLLDLKGLKKAEQQPLLDYFNRRGTSGGASASPLPSAIGAPAAAAAVAPATPATPVTPGTVAIVASREAMMARAAALGRGAMAQSAAAAAAVSSTGLKRIFALAESAKEGAAKKEGTFRKLFNT